MPGDVEDYEPCRANAKRLLDRNTGWNIVCLLFRRTALLLRPRPGREIIAGSTLFCCQAPRLAEPRFGEDALRRSREGGRRRLRLLRRAEVGAPDRPNLIRLTEAPVDTSGRVVALHGAPVEVSPVGAGSEDFVAFERAGPGSELPLRAMSWNA